MTYMFRRSQGRNSFRPRGQKIFRWLSFRIEMMNCSESLDLLSHFLGFHYRVHARYGSTKDSQDPLAPAIGLLSLAWRVLGRSRSPPPGKLGKFCHELPCSSKINLAAKMNTPNIWLILRRSFHPVFLHFDSLLSDWFAREVWPRQRKKSHTNPARSNPA